MSKARLLNFNSDSPFLRVQREVHQDSSLRQSLIKKLEKHFGGKVITYFTSFTARKTMVSDSDAEMIESILSVDHKAGEKIFLVINSPGGSGLAAERIVNICREYSNDHFEAVVPHMAKSAATMICFGAAAIHMSATAELGPVDPQVPYWIGAASGAQDDANWISAEEYVRSYDDLVKAAASGQSARIEPYVQQLNRYDSKFIEQLRSSQQLAKDISVRLLASGMLKGVKKDEIEKRIKIFLSQPEKSSHGRMINATEAVDCGLKVKKIDLQSDAWHTLWELYVRSNWSVTHRCGKVLETVKTSVAC